MAVKGGRRDGAGRKPGSVSVKSQAVTAKALAEGITPLEVMIENMRFAYDEAGDILAKVIALPEVEYDQFKELMRLRHIAQDCAKDAAPYCHPKLANVEMTGKDGGPLSVVIRKFTD